MQIMIQSHNCNSCGYVVPKNWQSGDLCGQCGDSVRVEAICAWCCHNVPEGKFCRSCGFEMIETRWFGVARMLKSFGVDKLQVNSRLNELDDADKLHHQQQYMKHWGPIVSLLDEMQFCENYLGTNKFIKPLQSELLALAPFPDERLERFSKIARPPYKKNIETLVEIIDKTPISLTNEIAILTVITHCEQEWASTNIRPYLKYLIDNRFNYPESRLQALFTLSNWRFETPEFTRYIKLNDEVVSRFDEFDWETLALSEKIQLENLRYMVTKKCDMALMEQGLEHKEENTRMLAALRLGKTERFGEFMSGDSWRGQFLIRNAAARCNPKDLVWFDKLGGEQVYFYVRYMPALIPEEFAPSLLRAAEKYPEQRWIIWNALHIAGILNNDQKKQVERFAIASNDGYTAISAIKFEFYQSYSELSKVVFQHAIKENDYQHLIYLLENNLLHEPQEVLSKIGLSYDIISSLQRLAETQLFPTVLAEKLIKFSQSTEDEISKDRIAEIICSQQDINNPDKKQWFPILWRYFVNDSPIFRQYSWPKSLLGFEDWIDKDKFTFDSSDIIHMFSSKDEFESDCLTVLTRMDEKDSLLLQWFDDNRSDLDDYLSERPEYAKQLFRCLTNIQQEKYNRYCSNIIAANNGYQANILLNFIYQANEPGDYIQLFDTHRDTSRLNDEMLACFDKMISLDGKEAIASQLNSFLNGYLLSKSAFKYIIDQSLSGNMLFTKYLPHVNSRIDIENDGDINVDANLLFSIYDAEGISLLIEKMSQSTLETKGLEIVTWLIELLGNSANKQEQIIDILISQIHQLFRLSKLEERLISRWCVLFKPAIADFLSQNEASQLGQYYQFIANQDCDRSLHHQLIDHLQSLDNRTLLTHLNGLVFAAHAFEFCSDDLNKQLVSIFENRLTNGELNQQFSDEVFCTNICQLLKSFFVGDSRPRQSVCKYIIQGLVDAHSQQLLGDNLTPFVELIGKNKETDIYSVYLESSFENADELPTDVQEPAGKRSQPPKFDTIPLSGDLLANINNWMIDQSYSLSWANACVNYYRSYKDTSAMMALALIPDNLSNIKIHKDAYQSLLEVALKAIKDADIFDPEKEFLAHGSLVIGLINEYCEDDQIVEKIKQELDAFITSHQLEFVYQDSLQELYDDKSWSWPGEDDG